MLPRIPFRIMTPPIVFLLFVFLLFAPVPLSANDLVDKLIDRIVSNEQGFLERVRQYNPILETYIQEVADDLSHGQHPVTDHYMIGKLDTSEGVSHERLFVSAGFRKSDSTVFYPVGFAQMVIPDAYDFNRETYEFEYVRREFLGDVRVLVFDMVPKDSAVAGKFRGRIWVEDHDYNLVRFNGTYTMSKASSLFFHFDSWRVNTTPGVWMPAFVYVEDAGYGPNQVRKRFKAQTRLWGYNPFRNRKLDELTDILIEAEDPIRDDSNPKDVSPVESQRIWIKQAEQNIIHRLEKSGLLAPAGEVDDVLNTVVNNLLVTNEINLDVHCRVLLTSPFETFSVGQAIVISRGLLDVLPDEASLAGMLATELAHIVLGHGTETMYAFSDQTMIDDKDVLDELGFARSDDEVEAANEKAVEILSKSPYAKDLSSVGLFLKALSNHAAALPNLLRPNLGNGLEPEGQVPRLGELVKSAPELDDSKIDQIAALPLGSRVRLNPWTNALRLIKAKPVALLTAKDKMPFHITPFMLHLTRVKTGNPSEAASRGKSPQAAAPGLRSQFSGDTSLAEGAISAETSDAPVAGPGQ